MKRKRTKLAKKSHWLLPVKAYYSRYKPRVNQKNDHVPSGESKVSSNTRKSTNLVVLPSPSFRITLFCTCSCSSSELVPSYHETVSIPRSAHWLFLLGSFPLLSSLGLWFISSTSDIGVECWGDLRKIPFFRRNERKMLVSGFIIVELISSHSCKWIFRLPPGNVVTWFGMERTGWCCWCCCCDKSDLWWNCCW